VLELEGNLKIKNRNDYDKNKRKVLIFYSTKWTPTKQNCVDSNRLKINWLALTDVKIELI
jgi:hypothetical protein